MTMQPPPRGFADPVLNSQAIFRAVMGTMARPGTVLALPVAPLAPPPLTPEAAAVALTLADHETAIWLIEALAQSPDVADFLRFFTGAELVDHPQDATFALATVGEAFPPLAAFAQGTDNYPDRSTTLILAVASLTSGPALHLEGPGIRERASLHCDPLPSSFIGQIEENCGHFPRGVDCILVGDGKVAGLPRTTRVSRA